MKPGTLLVVALALWAGPASAQRQVTRHMPINPEATIAIRNQAGSVQVIGWDRDSVKLRGTFAEDAEVLFGGSGRAAKVGVWEWSRGESGPASHFTVWVPLGSSVEIKTISSNVTVRGVPVTIGSADGHIRVTGDVDRVEAESINGNVEILVNGTWVRGRTGGGALTISGAVMDVGGNTVSGRLTATVSSTLRGNFTSVSGDIVFATSLEDGGLFEFDTHSGAVELRVPPDIALDLATVTGVIDNGLTDQAPVAGPGNRGQTLVSAAPGAAARVTVRTLRGAILLRH